MVLFIIIKGPSGVGKTTMVRRIAPVLAKCEKIAIIGGDFFSHIIYKRPFSDKNLDLKYENIRSAIINLAKRGYSIILHDLFRRCKDLDGLVSLGEKLKFKILIFSLEASSTILLQRNRERDPLDIIVDHRVQYLRRNTLKIRSDREIRIYTDQLSPNEVSDFMLNTIEGIMGKKLQ